MQQPHDQIMTVFRINSYKGSFDYVDPGNAVVAGWVKAKFYFSLPQMLPHLI